LDELLMMRGLKKIGTKSVKIERLKMCDKRAEGKDIESQNELQDLPDQQMIVREIKNLNEEGGVTSQLIWKAMQRNHPFLTTTNRKTLNRNLIKMAKKRIQIESFKEGRSNWRFQLIDKTAYNSSVKTKKGKPIRKPKKEKIITQKKFVDLSNWLCKLKNN